MALRCTTINHYAKCTAPWTGGAGSFVFWFYKLSLANATIAGLVDTADSTPLTAADPRITFGTQTDTLTTCGYTGNGGTTNNAFPGPWAAAAWQHAVVRWTATGTSVTSIGSALNGTTDALTGSSRDLSVNGTISEMWLGSSVANVNTYFAHVAYFDYQLSDAQITELQTTLPSGISGTAPVIYAPFLTDDNNDGTGGATYDFTLSGATIDSTNDGTLPALGAGGATGRPSNSSRMMLGVG